jgi:membrane protein implicated in regulation of membrane protease activity
MLLVVALVVLLLLPDPWNVFAAVVFGLLGLVELYLWNRTVRRRRKEVGVHRLVGQIGKVRVTCRPVGQVFVGGELWRARCAEGADAGESVRVAAVNELTLEVEVVG